MSLIQSSVAQAKQANSAIRHSLATTTLTPHLHNGSLAAIEQWPQIPLQRMPITVYRNLIPSTATSSTVVRKKREVRRCGNCHEKNCKGSGNRNLCNNAPAALPLKRKTNKK